MLPLSNGKSFLRLILIIHKSWDMQYFIHVLKISWTEATYIKVSRNSMLQPNLAFGRIQRKLHSQRFLLWNLHFRSPQHKSWPHGLAITSCSGRYFLVSYPISHLQITLAEVNPQWTSVPSGGQLVCLSWLLKSHLHSQFHLSTFFLWCSGTHRDLTCMIIICAIAQEAQMYLLSRCLSGQDSWAMNRKTVSVELELLEFTQPLTFTATSLVTALVEEWRNSVQEAKPSAFGN